ncbi:PaaI family thioesterase [Herbaspirillum sp. RTI4]|uniref:PaaI family thioesterase n=1 Tax=Herbaspirillum sp. RTI4 TaxID=3048640 RepID=UPI002AB54299|nr:PaaI family thioesterase [Herbaspirillum sp. RTI4]MDY7577084.1 PaaI family thioesterase [Herbaspirillum sp. RTI4]MEA9982264.1 PaaI family thioesterase [Herbaspirillum sp. RTI4]
MSCILPGDAMKADPMQSGFKDLLGHRVAEWGPDQVVVELDIGPQHLNLAGTVHGGVLASLIDVAGSLSGLYSPNESDMRRAVTLSLTTNFTGQASSGRIRAVANKRAGGASIYFSSVEISDDAGQIIAIGEVVNRYRKTAD